MNPKYFGDSYDIVKRFFCTELNVLGYTIVVNPMFTGEWNGNENMFLRFIGAPLSSVASDPLRRTALFIDPDTGVNRRPSNQHISLMQLKEAASKHELVFSFDQSFSRQHDANVVMTEKLNFLREQGCHAIYYDSHARFLFVANNRLLLDEFRFHLESLGLPKSRFFGGGT